MNINEYINTIQGLEKIIDERDLINMDQFDKNKIYFDDSFSKQNRRNKRNRPQKKFISKQNFTPLTNIKRQKRKLRKLSIQEDSSSEEENFEQSPKARTEISKHLDLKNYRKYSPLHNQRYQYRYKNQCSFNMEKNPDLFFTRLYPQNLQRIMLDRSETIGFSSFKPGSLLGKNNWSRFSNINNSESKMPFTNVEMDQFNELQVCYTLKLNTN